MKENVLALKKELLLHICIHYQIQY